CGIVANDIIAAANQLVGVSIQPFSDTEILENAGLEPEPPEPDLLSTEDVALDFFLGEPALTQAIEVATESSASDLTFSELILAPHHVLEIEALSFAPIVEAPILHQDIGLSTAPIAIVTRIDTPTLAQSIEAALQPLTFGLFLGTP